MFGHTTITEDANIIIKNGGENMPSIYLSPSLQPYNPCVTGQNEAERMNWLADNLVPYLDAMGISYTRSEVGYTLTQAINETNAGNYDLHLALHSNAAPETLAGTLRGTDIYYYVASTEGHRAAEILAKYFREIYPNPEAVNTRATTTLRELRTTNAPAVLIEIAYHDNIEDDIWMVENMGLIAQKIAEALAEYFSIPFVGI